MKKCPKCGKTFSNDNGFCNRCGVPLVTAETAEVPGVAENTATEATNTAEETATEAVNAVEETTVNGAAENVQENTLNAQETAKANEANTAAAPAAALNAAPAKKPGKGIGRKGLIAICAALAVVLVAVIAILAAGSGKAKKVINRDTIYLAYNEFDEYWYVYNGHGKSKVIFKEDVIYDTVRKSFDGSAMVVENDDDECFVVTIKGATSIGKVNRCKFSGDNSTLVYTLIDDDNDYVLYSYDIKSKKTTKIVKSGYLSSWIVSRNGKNVCFVDEDGTAYLNANGTKKKLGEKFDPIAVSDNGKLVYYATDEEDLCLWNNGKKTVLEESLSGDYILFNNSITEVLYSVTKDGKQVLYSYVNGKNKTKLLNGEVSGFYSAEDAYSYSTVSGTASFVDAKTIKGSILLVNGTYYYVRNLKDLSKIMSSSSVGDIFFSDDCKSAVYLNADVIYYMPDVKNPDRSKTVCETGYNTRFLPTSDGKGIYIFEDSDLYFCKINGKKKLVAKDADPVAYDGYNLYYYDEDDYDDLKDLYVSMAGRKGKRIAKKIAYINNREYPIAYKESRKNDEVYEVYVLDGSKVRKTGALETD